MATPVRLLNPKLLSPRSPAGYGKILDVKTKERSSKLSKQLYFPAQELPKARRTILCKSDIQIKVTDLSHPEKSIRKSLLVKTPEKLEILENGLNEGDLNVLGRGAFGTVVKGIYKNQDVAAKVVKRSQNENPREAKVLNFHHENVVKTIEVLINSNMHYAIVIMEYLKFSRHLKNVLDDDDSPLPNDAIVKYAADITKALAYCHQRHLAHMDVKPCNVLVCEGGVCKLCDFGNCFNVKEDSLEEYQYRGTIAYAAPEILTGNKPTVKCDVYSLGITLWQMVAGEMPYADLNSYEIVAYKVVKFDLRPKENFKDDFLKPLYSVCWSAKPEDRPNCLEILQLLKDCL